MRLLLHRTLVRLDYELNFNISVDRSEVMLTSDRYRR